MRFVTNSELSTHRDCHRRWWLSYYRRLTPVHEKLTGPMPLGTRVHYALQALHDPSIAVDPVEAYNQIARDDFERLEERWKESVFGIPEDDLKKFEAEVELGRIMVDGYIEWLKETGADSTFEVVGTEEKVDVAFATIDDVEVRLLGKLDLRVRRLSDNARLFVDYKTCGSITQRLQTIHMETQFLMYQLLERLHGVETGATTMTQGSMVGLLRKVKRTKNATPPFYWREEVHHNDIELRNYYARVYNQVVEMLTLEKKLREVDVSSQAHVAYPSPTRDCTWKCQFKDVCPMFDDGSDAERFLADNFVEYDPLTRYDEALEKNHDE